MTETTTLTPHQQLVNRLNQAHPQLQVIALLDRIEAIERRLDTCPPVKIAMPAETIIETISPSVRQLSRSEIMKAAWAKRKAK